MATTPIILDTDIGTDVDDVVALAFALQSPELDLRAITTVYVDTPLRARMVRAVLQVAGRTEIPLGIGLRDPLLRRDPIYWIGSEGAGLIDHDDQPLPALPSAVDLICQTVRQNPGQITLVAIGPLTNVAVAFLRDPDLPSLLKGLVLMAGQIVRQPSNWPYGEHNVRCDPEAAAIVVDRMPTLQMVPLDVTLQVPLYRADLAPIKANPHPLGALAADQVERYLDGFQRDETFMHDPLALASIVDPTIVQYQNLKLSVELGMGPLRGLTLGMVSDEGPQARVALEVDVARARTLLLNRLAGRSV